MKIPTKLIRRFLSIALLSAFAPMAYAQGTSAFTYQGQLRDGSTNANGSYSLTFTLFNAASGGGQIGGTLAAPSQSIVNGLFTVNLDFGGTAFDGSARWLEITVASLTATNTLAPRSSITPAPYALYSSAAATATTLNNGNWNASVGSYQGNANVLSFNVNNGFVLGLATSGAYVNGEVSASQFSFNSGGSISSDGQRGIQLDGSISASNLVLHGSSIQFPGQSGATMAVGTNGDFIFDNNLRITALGGLSLPAPGGSRAISANNQGITLDGVSISASSGVVLPTSLGGAVSLATTGNSLYIPAGGLTVNGTINANGFNQTSDRNVKEQFMAINSREILERVVGLPISSWNFKADGKARHLGPMAQDFFAAFRLGTDEKHIATVDADGVALAAIQGLHSLVKDKEAEIAGLKQRLEALEKIVLQQNGGGR